MKVYEYRFYKYNNGEIMYANFVTAMSSLGFTLGKVKGKVSIESL